MKSRNIFVILLLAICLLCLTISNVSADNNVEVSTFAEMNGNITAGYNVTLKNNITGLDGIKQGIIITRDTTVDGNGYTIDANGEGRFFVTMKNSVLTLKNITLKNGKADEGGAILGYNVNLKCENNVIFDNNTASDISSFGGGAIRSTDGDVSITSTNVAIIFTNNKGEYASFGGGAISCWGGGLSINASGPILFENNSVYNYGGAIYTNMKGNGVTITSKSTVIFRNNKATNKEGGAIYSENGDVSITASENILFENNAILSNIDSSTIGTLDGGVSVISTIGSITFRNNSGAIEANGDVIITALKNILFENNNATATNCPSTIEGHNVIITSTNSTIIFCNNTAKSVGAIIANNVQLNNAIFYGNNATDCNCIRLSNGANSNFNNCFWGLNYNNQTEIINDKLIGVWNRTTRMDDYVAPDYWLLLNILPSEKIVCDINNTFKIAFDKITNGTTTISINPIIANMVVNLTGDSNKVPSQAIGYFNFTTNHVGTYTIHALNIFNGKEIEFTTFTVDNSPFNKIAEIIKKNTTVNLEKDYNFYKDLDSEYINGIVIARNTTINGNGHSLDAKNLANIFSVNKGVTLTLKDINLVNARIAIVNNGILDLTNVKSNSIIYNNGVITSGVTFNVWSRPLITTYDSFFVVLKTVDGIIIKCNNLLFSDDQGHNYDDYIYNDDNEFYVCYAPVGIIGHVTFYNVSLSNYPSLVSSGDLNITPYSKKVVSNRNFVKTTPSKVMKNMLDDITTKVVKTTTKIIEKHTGKNIPVLTPILKNITHNIKTTVKSIFKFSNTFLRA